MRRYPPAYYFLLAFTNLIVGNTYSNMVIEGILSISDVFPYAALLGGTCEILLLSVSLGRRVKSEEDASKRKIEGMADELRIINQDLDHKVEERTRFARSILNNITVGLLRIEAHGLIAGDFSRSSLDIFARDDLKGQYIWDLLDLQPQTEQRSMMQSIFELVIGEDQTNFQFNKDHLPRFYYHGDHVIELNWSPFLNGQQVEAILLLARDVTYIRRLEKEHQERADEAKFIMVVARHGVSKIRQYLQDETQCMGKIRSDMAMLTRKKTEILRALHTIKGNSRSFGMNDISQLAHALEDKVISMSADLPAAEIQELLGGVQHKLSVYGGMVEKYFTAETQRITGPLGALQEKLKVLNTSHQDEHRHLARDMQWIINSMKYDALEDPQFPLQHQARELVMHLSKTEPLLTLHAPGILVSSHTLHRLRSILNHLLRNAVDHGLEKPSVRQALHKPAQGCIEIDFHPEGNWMVAQISDDGSGLNLQKIWKKAAERGLSRNQPRIRDVAELIFESGLSAKDEAGMISGRGIGLDAVRDLCQEIGGTIQILSQQDLSAEFKTGTASMPVVF
ncbi:MAG TPA: ATP-binding protein [Oligoflexus sp.]|uniref:ATP-binding protein n=1 Tax=Oligoflexus sp. TaxID=1971216 RepID=UPI002D3B811C|nr:ATP-binding protein [Oligoflexus sp.]HYX38360.1 ATP-binding protein [Oligoflexus sp.]